MFDEFKEAFADADEVVITDIYSAGEKALNVSSKELVEGMQHPNSSYVSKEDFLKIKSRIFPHDAIIFLGAGDITKLGRDVFSAYQKKPPKIKLGLVFGGRSSGHESSILLAKNIYQNLDSSIYDITLFGITKEGKWQLCNDFAFKEQKETFPLEVFKKLKNSEACLSILHGPSEDGTIQGLFDTLGIACSNLSSDEKRIANSDFLDRLIILAFHKKRKTACFV